MEHLDHYNILAIKLIEFLGNDRPAQEQIDLVELIVSRAMTGQGAHKVRGILQDVL